MILQNLQYLAFEQNSYNLLIAKNLLIFVDLNHSPENKEVRWRGDFYVLHWPYDCIHLIACSTHHRTGVYIVVFT